MNLTLYRSRQLVAFLCLLAVLFLALTPANADLFFAIFVPLWFFFAAIVTVQAPRVTDGCFRLPIFRNLLAFPSRPPPAE